MLGESTRIILMQHESEETSAKFGLEVKNFSPCVLASPVANV